MDEIPIPAHELVIMHFISLLTFFFFFADVLVTTENLPKKTEKDHLSPIQIYIT